MSNTHKKPTIHEIATVLGLDSSTVSRALNNSERVKLVTRQLVQQKAKELGYMPNMLAANLRRKKSNTIGVVVPRVSRHFFSSTIAGIEEVAYKSGYHVIICQSLEEEVRERRIVKNLIANRVDGILISASMETKSTDHFIESVNQGTPVVFFDRYVDQGMSGAGKVVLNDFEGGFIATEHLIKGGCKKIAHFSAAPHVTIYKDRLAGYKAALTKYGFSYERNRVIESELLEKDGKHLAKKIIAEHKDVDGIFAANDVVALGALKYFKSQGVAVPERIALVGFSNEPTSEVIDPSLTTVDQSGNEMGQLACTLMLEYIANGVENVARKIIRIRPKLIERDSTKRLYHFT